MRAASPGPARKPDLDAVRRVGLGVTQLLARTGKSFP